MRVVFARLSYAALGIVVACAMIIVALALPAASLWSDVLASHAGLSEKLGIIATSAWQVALDSFPGGTVYVALLAILLGINIPLLVYYARAFKPGVPLRGLSPSILGLLASLFGIGCAACGTIFFGAVFGSLSGVVTALPFQGREVGYLGLATLALSSYIISRDITRSFS